MVDPTKGSEAGMAWQYIVALSAHFTLHVVTQSYAGNDLRIAACLRQSPLPNVSFYFIPLSTVGWLHRFPINYALYNGWHLRSARFISRQFKHSGIAIIHKLNTTGYRIPGFCYWLPYRFVWGPIDGFTNVDTRLLGFLNRKGRLAYYSYNFINRIERTLSPTVRLACAKSAVLLAATQDSYQYLKQRVKNKPIAYVLETGVSDSIISSETPPKDPAVFQIAWVGQCIHRKNLPFLLRTLAQLPSHMRYQVQVVGDGPLRHDWQQLAVKLGVAPFVAWHGWVERAQALAILARSDVFAQTSIREINSTVVFEAMANGVPVICLKTSGMKDIISEDIGHLVAITDPQTMIDDLRDTLIAYYQDPSLLAEKRERIRVLAQTTYRIETQTHLITEIYETCFQSC